MDQNQSEVGIQVCPVGKRIVSTVARSLGSVRSYACIAPRMGRYKHMACVKDGLMIKLLCGKVVDITKAIAVVKLGNTVE
ncbi:hypothetical protein KSC_013740 [Ktedonobacter sp. SOSP1-52]|nr:hypothetical protein KSC_013740 [Ktedonobacter sp. SOSP1-52]